MTCLDDRRLIFFLFKICTYSSDKEYVISTHRIKMPFTSGSHKWMFSHFTWSWDNLPPFQLRLPLAKAGKVVSSHPPLSLPCCGWTVPVTVTDPGLQLSCKHCCCRKASRETRTIVRVVLGDRSNQRGEGCWEKYLGLAGKSTCPSGDGHTWGRLALNSTDWVPHMLSSAGKSQRGIFNVLKSQANGKSFFIWTPLKGKD